MELGELNIKFFLSLFLSHRLFYTLSAKSLIFSITDNCNIWMFAENTDNIIKNHKIRVVLSAGVQGGV